MTNETPRPRVEHLFSRAIMDRSKAVAVGDRWSLVTPETVSFTFGFPFPASFPNDDLVAAVERLFAVEGAEALQYGGGNHASRLPGIVAERARGRGLDPHEEEVLLTNGATNAIDLVCRAFLDPGDAVFVEGPTFTWSLRAILGHGVEVVDFPVDEEGVDVDAVADDLASRRRDGRPLPKLFYAIPDFQNPTGATLSRSRRERLLDLAAAFDFVVIEDDAYGELRYDGEAVPTLRSLDDEGRVAHVGTFSKVIAPGVRTGWIVADEGVVDRLSRIHSGGPSAFTAGLLATYCESGALDAAVPELCEAYRERRDHMLGSLSRHMPDGVDWTDPDGGFFVWVELPDGVDAAAMLVDAIEAGVAYLPGRMFYADGERGTNCLRLSFSSVSPDDIERGIEALARTTRRTIDDD